MSDEAYIERAIELARRGSGLVSPNPMVGSVVVSDGAIVGEGFHEGPGLPHAEIMALNHAGERARGATLYTSLEPCDHYGRTPPCTEAIVRAGIARVVSATRDPNPVVDGQGIRTLRARGVEVREGILADEADRLNEAFAKHVRTGMPFVIWKCDVSSSEMECRASPSNERICAPGNVSRIGECVATMNCDLPAVTAIDI